MVFGINTFLGTIVKTIITLIVADKRGLGLDVHDQVRRSLDPPSGGVGVWASRSFDVVGGRSFSCVIKIVTSQGAAWDWTLTRPFPLFDPSNNHF